MEQGKQQLLDTILQEATASAESITREAAEKSEQLLAKENAEMRSYLQRQAAKDEVDGTDLVTKAATAAAMEGKKALLKTKREILDKVYGRLLERLYALGPKDYLALVEALLERYASEQDKVLLAKDCAITFGDVQALPVARKRALKVEYDEAMQGGVKLVSDSLVKDLTFEALCQSVQAATEMELAIQLFEN